MNTDYNATYLASTLITLQGDLQDLGKWSVYNDDEYNEEITLLKETLSKIVNKVNADPTYPGYEDAN